ncbi:uncharacterized protein LOC130762574 isoform X2 [Actinidia eriantha]|uniref:uncharacterized protein LOC130762574 isoform X2 n=1 Tax=Actinidia eriantha TaxID=165200 RepID=UPI00258A70DC|nr:uncharacterized protein LOC130762574 isoform X2 [Actinidia eriantha]
MVLIMLFFAGECPAYGLLSEALAGDLNLLKNLDDGVGLAKTIEDVQDCQGRKALHYAASKGKGCEAWGSDCLVTLCCCLPHKVAYLDVLIPIDQFTIMQELIQIWSVEWIVATRICCFSRGSRSYEMLVKGWSKS